MQNLFTYPIQLDNISGTQKFYKLEPTVEQCKEIARVLQVEAVSNLNAEIKLQYNKKTMLARVEGEINADMEQISVVSLDKFTKNYKTEFSELYTTDTNYEKNRNKEVELNWQEEIPVVIYNNRLDLADVIIEQLALVMDYNPRKEGETFSFVSEFDEETTKKQNPFTILQKIAK